MPLEIIPSPTPDTEALVAALQTASIQGYAADPEGKLFLQAAAEIKRLQGAEIDAGLAIAQFNRNELVLRAKLKTAREALVRLKEQGSSWDRTLDFPGLTASLLATATLAALEE